MSARYTVAPARQNTMATCALPAWPDRSRRCVCEHRTNQHSGQHGRVRTPSFVPTGRCLAAECPCTKYERAEVGAA